jgi:ElaB/YqjD/DUF883 family membrane-anchored ribosome-binding protein
MGQDTDAIRGEVEQTRERMGETIDALGHKADVKTRTKQNIGGKVDTLKENPLGLVAGAVAVGFLAGMLIPSSRVEDEQLGPMADQVKEQAKETGQDALERGKQVAQSAAEQAREATRQQSRELADSAREHADSVSAR